MIGVPLMLLAAFFNAAASVLQRYAARAEPASMAFSVRLFGDLLRRPVWLLGVLAMLSGFLLHAVSISVSRIALVQPLLIVELPLTLLLAAPVFGLRIPRRDWIALVGAAAGVALFLATLRPSGGDPARASIASWAVMIAGMLAGIAALVVAGHRGSREHRAALLGIATGAAFGLNSSLVAGVGASVAAGGNLFTTWQTYGIAVVGPGSFFLLQNALQAGNLVASQPGFTLTNPLVSVAIGLTVFGENGRTGWFLVGAVAGALLIGVGTVVLARSPLLDPAASQPRSDESGSRRSPAA